MNDLILSLIPQDMLDRGQYWWPWNPLVGCGGPYSPGCLNCWAIEFENRFKTCPEAVTDRRWNRKQVFIPAALDIPAKCRKPKVFAGFRGDGFMDGYNDENLWRVFLAMCMPGATKHKFLILTKRPDNMLEFVRRHKIGCSHIYLGTSAENQECFDIRMAYMNHIHGFNQWLSLEPLLGPIDLSTRDTSAIKFIVAGPETGKNARPCKREWIQTIADYCAAHNIEFFDKKEMLKNGQ